MKILGLGVPELVIILVVVLLIFGPKNLPKLGNAVGKGIKGLRKGMEDGDEPKKEEGEVVEEAVVEKVEKLEAVEVVEDSPIEEAKPKVRRVVKKKVAAPEE
ncbi:MULTISPECIES: twin-arginine translocase TatA/TatE family subunit [unclassified Adlercreutzia]|uniref:twin-arginine translocase TatA/TatE family subunit n=1 Tax=unclassified Adlercreutzia TaxID=2636013 RepID=UPI0013EA5464|nr:MULTISPECIES: twin-arginine translocase TatA/TatE family subunit [unclassified Adlercreutzia]